MFLFLKRLWHKKTKKSTTTTTTTTPSLKSSKPSQPPCRLRWKFGGSTTKSATTTKQPGGAAAMIRSEDFSSSAPTTAHNNSTKRRRSSSKNHYKKDTSMEVAEMDSLSYSVSMDPSSWSAVTSRSTSHQTTTSASTIRHNNNNINAIPVKTQQLPRYRGGVQRTTTTTTVPSTTSIQSFLFHDGVQPVKTLPRYRGGDDGTTTTTVPSTSIQSFLNHAQEAYDQLMYRNNSNTDGTVVSMTSTRSPGNTVYEDDYDNESVAVKPSTRPPQQREGSLHTTRHLPPVQRVHFGRGMVDGVSLLDVSVDDGVAESASRRNDTMHERNISPMEVVDPVDVDDAVHDDENDEARDDDEEEDEEDYDDGNCSVTTTSKYIRIARTKSFIDVSVITMDPALDSSSPYVEF